MLSRKLVFAIGVAASFPAASCAVVGYDLDGYHPAESTTTGSGGAGGVSTGTSSSGAAGAPPNACTTEGDHVCAELPPKGFSGPVALVVGDDARCEKAFPDQLYEGQTAPKGADAECTCSCDAAPCGTQTTITTYTDAACSVKPLPYTDSEATCAAVSPVGSPHVSVTPVTTKPGLDCAPTAGITKTPPTSGERVVACGGAKSGAGCSDGEACLPKPEAPAESKLCIFRAGDEACPKGFDKQLLFTSTKDSRACTSCECGAPASTCDASVDFYSDATCLTQVGIATDKSGCTALSASFDSIKTTLSSPCKASLPMPTGEVAGVDPTTFCCR